MLQIDMNVSGKYDQKERLAHLDTMRAFTIVMVVAGHGLGYCRELPKTTHAVMTFIVQICVAVFFLVDGFLFARARMHNHNVSYWHYVKKSATRLLLPWLIFTVGYTGIRYIFEVNKFFDNKMIVGNSIWVVAKYSYGAVVAPHLYFLFSLFLIRLIAPVTGRLFQINRYAVLVLCVMYVLFYRLPVNNYLAPYLRIEGGQEPILHAFWGLQFYLVGIMLYLFKDRINNTKAFYMLVSLLFMSFMISVPNSVIGIKSIITQYLYLLSFYFGISFFPENIPMLRSIGSNTMGIYILHAPIIMKGLSLLINRLITMPLLSYVSLIFIVFTTSYLLAITINRIPYGSLLFGIPYSRSKIA